MAELKTFNHLLLLYSSDMKLVNLSDQIQYSFFRHSIPKLRRKYHLIQWLRNKFVHLRKSLLRKLSLKNFNHKQWWLFYTLCKQTLSDFVYRMKLKHTGNKMKSMNKHMILQHRLVKL